MRATLTPDERIQTARALRRSGLAVASEYVLGDVAVGIGRERQLIAEAERIAARGEREERRRQVREWGEYRARMRARMK